MPTNGGGLRDADTPFNGAEEEDTDAFEEQIGEESLEAAAAKEEGYAPGRAKATPDSAEAGVADSVDLEPLQVPDLASSALSVKVRPATETSLESAEIPDFDRVSSKKTD